MLESTGRVYLLRSQGTTAKGIVSILVEVSDGKVQILLAALFRLLFHLLLDLILSDVVWTRF